MTGHRRSAEAPESDPRGGERLLERILVGVGGSGPSLSALRYALHLARASSGSVATLIVEELRLPGAAALGDGEVSRHLAEEAQAAMRARWDEAERSIEELGRGFGHPIEIRRECGRVVDCIVAGAETASLLVVGKRGCRDEHGGLLGSNTELILRRTHKPVLLTPVAYQPPDGVLVAYGGSTPGRAILGIALELSRSLDLPLCVLTIEENERRRAALWDEARRRHPELEATASFEAAGGDAAAAILRRKQRRTLLVMGAYGHPRLYRMVLGSVTEEVMRAARGPVLLSGKQEASAPRPRP